MPVRYYDWIAHHRRRTPDKMALVDLASGRRFSYKELDARVSRLGAWLRDALKVARGDRVAVLALNTTDTLELQFACFRIGAIFLPLNTRLTVPELRYITGDAAPKVMVHDDDLAETALAVAKLCDVAATVRLGPGGAYEAGIAAATPLERFEEVMQGLDRAVGAIKSLIEYAGLRKEVPDIASSSKASARAVLEKTLKAANGAAALDEVASKKLLRAYGIPISKEEVAQTAAEAVKIAKQIGFPVVAKVVSPDILHKSDVGGVELNLASAAEVKKAFNDITARVKKLKGKPKLEGILIAQQVKADLELVVGASLDAEMGPVVLFGTGGVDIELMKDVALAGAPLDAAEAKELIARTKAGVKMKGYRGKPALHEPSAVKALVGLSNLMADANGRIASIDVNPFLINSKLGVAVDGLIVLNNAAANKAAGH